MVVKLDHHCRAYLLPGEVFLGQVDSKWTLPERERNILWDEWCQQYYGLCCIISSDTTAFTPSDAAFSKASAHWDVRRWCLVSSLVICPGRLRVPFHA